VTTTAPARWPRGLRLTLRELESIRCPFCAKVSPETAPTLEYDDDAGWFCPRDTHHFANLWQLASARLTPAERRILRDQDGCVLCHTPLVPVRLQARCDCGLEPRA
jgi:ferredoxin